VSFDVSAEAYGAFMGRFSEPLAALFLDLARVGEGDRALDVGCGTGAVTARLVERLGPAAVAAVDPSPSFVDAVVDRCPGVDVRRAPAEKLPFADASFDASLAQLVVHFMARPVVGLREMGRVTRPGGVVAACVWDHAGGGGPLAHFWRAVHALDPDAAGEAHLPGTRQGHLDELLVAAGMREVRGDALRVTVRFDSFEEWWDPFLLGVGPAGVYVAALDDDRREELHRRCADSMPAAPFDIEALAWAATGLA
jgi:SAM-dependent methyltransferase